jgi:hypothetical protein
MFILETSGSLPTSIIGDIVIDLETDMKETSMNKLKKKPLSYRRQRQIVGLNNGQIQERSG